MAHKTNVQTNKQQKSYQLFLRNLLQRSKYCKPKRGQNIANHLLKSSQAFVNRFTNNTIVLREYDLLKNE